MIKVLRTETAVSYYKKCLFNYYGKNKFRASFVKPLSLLQKTYCNAWKSLIFYAFEYYDHIKQNFGNIPIVARSDFPEPFIFFNDNIFLYILDKYIENECDWQMVVSIVKDLQKQEENILTVDDLWNFLQKFQSHRRPLEIIMAINGYCKINKKLSLWRSFKSKYDEEIKKII